jgi:hypothetical protein
MPDAGSPQHGTERLVAGSRARLGFFFAHHDLFCSFCSLWPVLNAARQKTEYNLFCSS